MLDKLHQDLRVLEKKCARYLDLYDFAPVGYCTISAEGLILEANLFAADIFGVSRNALVRQDLGSFIWVTDLSTYDLHRKLLLETGQTQSIEVQILHGQCEPLWVNLVASLAHWDGVDVMRIVFTNINDQKRIERDLTERQNELKVVQRLAHLGTWHWDLQTNVQTWSDEIFASYGIPAQCVPLTLPNIQNQFTESSWTDLSAALDRCRMYGTPYKCDAEMVWEDGSHHWVAIVGHAVRDQDGTITALYGTLQDVTERIRAKLDLHHSEARLDCILESTSDGIFAIDSDGKVIRFNKKFGDMWRIPPDLLTCMVAPALLNHVMEQLEKPEEFLASVHALYTSDLEMTGPISFKDGRVFERFTSPLMMDSHNIGRVWSFRDITERQRTENALRESKAQLQWTEESFRLMVESVSDCALVMLNPEGQIVSWNCGAQQINGYSAQEIIGQHFSLFHQRVDIDCGGPLLELNTAIAEGYCKINGWRLRKGGTKYWASVVLTAVRDNTETLRGFAKLTRDLTEFRRNDQLLNDKNIELQTAWIAADNANRVKSDFLASMSHELRTPLNSILGFAQLIDTGIPPPSPNQKRNLDQILNGGWYLLELINDILDFAQIDSGKLSLSLESISLLDILYDCQALIAPLALKRAISIAFPVIEQALLVFVDRTRTKQILLNLLSNAIKYNNVGGSVMVECALYTSNLVRISIRDTGLGMTHEQMEQLFQPFNRLGREFGVEMGAGIGLVVTKRLVELMHGAVGVTSVIGTGSTFWIDLPLSRI